MKLKTDEQAARKVLAVYLDFHVADAEKWLMFQNFQNYRWATGEFNRGLEYAFEKGWLIDGPKAMSYTLTEDGFEEL